MGYKEQIKKVNDNEFVLDKQGKMNVGVRFFFSEKLIRDLEEDAIKQAVNVATLPGIVENVVVLPDAHVGYGFPIGGVAAFDLERGIISPGGVGYDIDCSVRLLSTNIKVEDFIKKKKEILHSVFRSIPSGVGRDGEFKINFNELDNILKEGAEWAVKNGFGTKEDLKHLEDGGCLKPSNSVDVSQRAKKRGIGQIGTLGSGNHFLEFQKVENIFDEDIAEKLGIHKDTLLIMIHCGSRGLGHQVASDYIQKMEEEFKNVNLIDRELIYAPIQSELGKKYFSAMNCSANFAFANKQIITHKLREQLKHYFPYSEVKVVYEVCHNIAKIEEYNLKGKNVKLCVHRKGATRSFDGQPVLIPGSMGTASYVLIGTKTAEEKTFGSTAHGAGRVESRTYARNNLSSNQIKIDLEKKGIAIETMSSGGLVEEAPEVYKDIDEVVKVSNNSGIGKLVAKLIPLAVMKG